MRHQIRRINPADAEDLREIRLQALLSNPGASDSSYEKESDLSAEGWSRRATDASTGEQQSLFVVDGPRGFVAMAGAYTPVDLTTVRRLYGMWVAPESRLTGLGQRLIEAITIWSTSVGAGKLQLWVVDDNHAARRLYARAGFRTTGVSQPLPSNPAVTETLLELTLATPDSSIEIGGGGPGVDR